MSGADSTAVARLAQQVVAKRAGRSATATAVAAVGQRTYEEFGRVVAPLIGQVGVDALIGRAVHLARREFPWLGADSAGPLKRGAGSFAQFAQYLEQADDSAAAAAAGVVFGLAAGLLATLIGEGLTASVLYKAWPDAFPMPAKRSDEE